MLRPLVCGFIFKETVSSRTTCCHRRRFTACVYNVKYAGERVRDVYDVSRTTAVARGRPTAVRRANAVRTPHTATTATPHHRRKKRLKPEGRPFSLAAQPSGSECERSRVCACAYGNNIIRAHARDTATLSRRACATYSRIYINGPHAVFAAGQNVQRRPSRGDVSVANRWARDQSGHL